MHQVRKLITQIRASLSDAPPPLPLATLAAEYARWREEAARRLEACAAMLAKGSEHSALEQAEAQPPLLDLVAELSFAEEPQWQSLCGRNELPVGPLLDARTVAALDEVYAKGLSPNSTLYQDYRAVVTARDDGKALHAIRTIAQVNPSDANAQAELDRLRNKFMHAKLDALRAALSANDDEATVDLVDELEEISVPEKLQAHPDYPRGYAVRKRVRLARAVQELPTLLGELEHLQKSGDWLRASERLTSLDEQERELGLVPDAAQASRQDAVRKFVEDRSADAAEQQRFMQAVERLRFGGEQAATRAAGASTLTLKEAEELQAKFDQLEHEVKQFRRTVPAGAAADSIQASRRTVHGAASRLRGGMVLRRVALLATVVLVLGAGLGWIGRVALVKSYREKLAVFQQQGQALSAQELLRQIQDHNILWIHSSPDLQAATAETGRWVAGQVQLRDQAQARIAALEKEEPEKANTAEMYEGLAAARTLVDTLAQDMALPLKERISAVQRTLDAMFAKLREEGHGTWRTTFSEAQALLSPLSYDKPSAEAVAVLAKAAPVLLKLESEVNQPVPALRPAPEMVEAFQTLSKKDQDLRTAVNSLNAARAAMDEADTLEAYAAALASYTEVRFAETSLARPVLTALPKADEVETLLLMSGDRDAWRAVELDKAFGVAMHPQDVRQDEVELLLGLRDDPDLKDVWQCTTVEEGEAQTAYSRGQLHEYLVGSETRLTGRVWKPGAKDLAPAFADAKLTKSGGSQNVSNITLSPTSRLLEGLKLQELTDASGTQWTRSAFEVLHDIVQAPAGSGIARAIFMQHIGALTSLRPYEWGRHYCPSLNRDLAELSALCGGRRLNSYEWMLPATTAKLEGKLSTFFENLKKRDYLDEARRFRDIALALRDADVVFAGYVDKDGAAHLLQKARSATELWGLGGARPVLLRVDPGAPNAGLGAQTKKCQPFSPLIQISLDRAALVRKYKATDPFIPFLQEP
jgi:hypothetical protein